MGERVEDDLLGDEVVRDPQTFYGRIRERTPVHWNARYHSWLLTRYDDVVIGYRSPAFSAARTGPLEERPEMAEASAILSRWMVFTDPPEHTRLRRACTLAFAPRRVAMLEPRIAALALGPREWERHFGAAWERVVAAKQRYDPDGLLTPGPAVF